MCRTLSTTRGCWTGPRCINKCLTLKVKWVPGDFRVGQIEKSQGQFCQDGREAIAQDLNIAQVWSPLELARSDPAAQPWDMARTTRPREIQTNWLVGTCSRKPAQGFALEHKSFPTIFFHTTVAQCNDWSGTFLLKSLCEGLSSYKGFC